MLRNQWLIGSDWLRMRVVVGYVFVVVHNSSSSGPQTIVPNTRCFLLAVTVNPTLTRELTVFEKMVTLILIVEGLHCFFAYKTNRNDPEPEPKPIRRNQPLVSNAKSLCFSTYHGKAYLVWCAGNLIEQMESSYPFITHETHRASSIPGTWYVRACIP